ncbi:MAG: HEAT repeat domain-containing protein [Planctomycetes bacterium]|nr:HEAT repeat domain-containing protein [Planctomycetota bacterium]
MKRHRWIGIVLGLLLATTTYAQSQLDSDEQTLKNHNPPLPTDGKGLLEFFKKRSMKEGDAKHLGGLVQKLGSDVYREREPAARELKLAGSRALPFLRAALSNHTLEMKRRAEDCIRTIEASMQTEPIAAAARVLAARKEPKAAEVLFNYLPSIVSDAFLEEELLTCLGRLTIEPGKVDPMFVNALKDPFPFKRQVAAYLIGRRSGAEYREKLREMLGDPDAQVRERVLQGLYGKRPVQALDEALSGDETILREAKIQTTQTGLLDFFRKRTLNEADQRRFRSLVRNLGHGSYFLREQASQKLIKEGMPVVAFLKEVEYDSSAELSHRAQQCLEKIRESSSSTIPIAAAHLLARPQQKQTSPAELIQTLLAYAPFADDEVVEEEILTCLTMLSLRETKVEPALIDAIGDASPVRRGAAAYVLGHVGLKSHVAKVRGLLDDPHPVVRLRAAQGMLAARDKSALPSFVKLINTLPAPYLPKVEEALYRLADDKGPTETIHAGSPGSRQKVAKAWDKWLNDNAAKIDLAAIDDRESYLGLITVAEYDSRIGNIQGQVWEGTRGGPKRFSFAGVMGAMDAHTLPNGRVLVAENNANRVTERDSKGNILWDYRTPVNPICCQRLPNGNTFIASYNMVMEVRPNKTEVYRYTPGPQFYIFSAHKAKNGHIVAITAQGQIIEMDATGKQIRTVQTNTQGNWCSVEMQPNGNFLVASMNTGTVREIDRKGTEIWTKSFPGVFRATKLPNGNVLVASMNTREVAEMDRAGNIRWRITTNGRPWGIHYR